MAKCRFHGAVGDQHPEKMTYARQSWQGTTGVGNSACVFGMASRLYNLLHWNFRDLPQTMFVIAESFVSQEEGRLTKRNTTVQSTQMIQQNKSLDYKPQVAQCVCLRISGEVHYLLPTS